ncbi:MAG TPA: PHB depolymerase family esterase [Polyangiaceae bacterium]
MLALRHTAAVALTVLALGCGSSSDTPAVDAGTSLDGSVDDAAASADGALDATPDSSSLVAARPFNLKVPTGYDKSKPTPLVVLLHGYTASGATQEAYFQFAPVADAKTFLYATPDGTQDKVGNRFWNATDACCNLDGSPVDDVAYINAVIDDVEKKYNVDTKRIFLVGHSNGAFMAHRLACDSAPRIAAIAALAGDVWADGTKCNPQNPVAILQIHGTADAVIAYAGGKNGNLAVYPSAPASVATWAAKNGCASTATPGAPLDLDSVLLGSETTTVDYTGCQSGGAAFLWTIQGGTHLPTLQGSFATTVYGFLAAHPKP